MLLAELFTAESKSQVYAHLHEFLRVNPSVAENLGWFTHMDYVCACLNHYQHLKLEFVCYDDGCHLRKYARNTWRKKLTPTAEKLATIEIVIDKMHMTGHIDKWCLANCNPSQFPELNKVISM